jgi:hypothetical protein
VLEVSATESFRAVAGAGPGQSSLIYLVEEKLASHRGSADPWEQFAGATEAALVRAADWLERRPVGAFERLRGDSIKVDVLVDAWIDQNQFDVELPAAFVRACGRAGLAIAVVTND